MLRVPRGGGIDRAFQILHIVKREVSLRAED